MANGFGALTLADMLRQGVPADALQARQTGLADALRTAPARRPPKPFPRELFDQPPESIPEQYLTDPLFAGAYNTYRGTQPTPSPPGALLRAPPEQIPEQYLSNPAFAQAYHAANRTQPTSPQEPAAQRPWFADVPLEEIPEEMLTDPDFAAAYNAWQGTQATEPTGLEEDEEVEALSVENGPEGLAPGVYPVEGEPGMVDVVLGGGAGGRMSEDEFYGSPELTAAVREAMAPQREAEELAALPVAQGESEAVETAPGETTVYLPPEVEKPAGGVEVAVGAPQIQRRVPAATPAPPMTPAQQQAALEAVRSGREATRAVAEGPVLRRETPSAVANGKGNGAAAQVADLVKTAAPAVQQAMADNLITPEGLRLLTVLTRDPTLMRIGEIVAGEAASERQLKSKEALAKQTAADKAAAARDLAQYREGMVRAAQTRANAATRTAGRVGRLTPFQETQLQRQAQLDEYRQLKDLSTASDKALFADALDALQTMERVAPGVTFGEVPKEVPATGLGERFLSGVGLRGWMGPNEAEARQALQNLRDIVKRARSGAAITAQEERTYLQMLGDQALASPQAITTALSQFRRTFGRRLAGLQSPYEKVLHKYKGPKAAEFLERPAAMGSGGERPSKRITRTVGGETRVWNGTAWVKE